MARKGKELYQQIGGAKWNGRGKSIGNYGAIEANGQDEDVKEGK
jgi:hypothetical protein